MSARLAFLWLPCALALAACGSDDEGSLGPPPRYRIPGCEAYDTSPCDIRDESCRVRLMGIAVCLRQDSPADLPPVSVLPEAEVVSLMREEAASRGPVPNRHEFETAFAMLGLVAPGSFETDAMIDSTVEWLAGYYTYETKSVIIVDHGNETDPQAASDVLVHELVHALQDREVDLATWFGLLPPTFDARLAAQAVVEGEARFQQLRYRAPMLGIDPRRVSWARTFQNGVEYSESWVLEQDSPLLAASQSFPYAWGARLTGFDWERTGHSGVLERFSAPPPTTHAILTSVDAYVADDFTPSVSAPPVPPAGFTSLGEDVLGAFGTFLVVAPVAPLELAHEIALAWRGDRFDVFLSAPDELGATVEVMVWSVDFAGAEAANAAKSALRLSATGTARVMGTRLTAAVSDRPTDVGWAFPAQ